MSSDFEVLADDWQEQQEVLKELNELRSAEEAEMEVVNSCDALRIIDGVKPESEEA